MSEMRKEMLKPSDFGAFAHGPGQRFQQETLVSSTKMQNGRAVEEKYATKAKGVVGHGGQRLVERH